MVSIADRVQARLSFTDWLGSLSPENRAIVEGWLCDPRVAGSDIQRAIAEDDPETGFVGFRIAETTLRRYRRVSG